MLITLRALTGRLNPLGVLSAQVFVNLLLELCIGVDLARDESGENLSVVVQTDLEYLWQG